jgi:hypothetical protein
MAVGSVVAPRTATYIARRSATALARFLARWRSIAHPRRHSDGGSIALILAGGIAAADRGRHAGGACAGRGADRRQHRGGVKTAFETTDLRAKLARHHADVDSAFLAGTDLARPEFRAWNIEDYLPASLAGARDPGRR